MKDAITSGRIRRHIVTSTPAPEGKKWVFVKWITRDGKRVYASWYGKKAFRILVDAA